MGKPTKIDDPITVLHEHGLDVEGNAMYITGETIYAGGEGWLGEPGVEYLMATKVVKNVQFLMKQSKDKPILVHMKTDGGEWNEGMAIYDALKFCPNPVVVLNYTHASSMSSIMLQAANKRVMMPHSYFMFHEGEQAVGGTEKQVRSYLKFSKEDNDIMLDIYINRMKQKGKYKHYTRAKIKKMLQDLMNKKEDVYLTAKETVEWGLADSVFNGNWDKLCVEGKRSEKIVSKIVTRSQNKAKKRNRRRKSKA